MAIEPKLLVIAAVWVVAAVVLFAAGCHVGQTNRYDDCATALLPGGELVYVCRTGVRAKPLPPTTPDPSA